MQIFYGILLLFLRSLAPVTRICLKMVIYTFGEQCVFRVYIYKTYLLENFGRRNGKIVGGNTRITGVVSPVMFGVK